MDTGFQLLFKTEILHSYFEEDICTCLEFKPSKALEELLKRFKFTISGNTNGFLFYSSSTGSLSTFLDHIKTATGQDCFEFDLINNSEAFYSFTPFPLDWTGQLQYDSSLMTALPEAQTFLLTETLSPRETTGTAGKLKVRFNDVLTLQADGQALNFKIRFEARATQWQYYVVNRNAVPLENAAVKGKGDVAFENSGTVTIETGEKALLFSSGDQLIPLSRFPKQKFDLVRVLKPVSDQKPARSSASEIIVKGLPNPDPLKMGIATVNDKTQVSSPIYIYV
jgi:hypothetical protein